MRLRFRFVGCLLLWTVGFCWATGALAQSRASFQAIDLHSGLTLDQLARQLATKRLVFIGEIHNRYDNHVNRLEIIERLHALEPDMAIGVEYFQQPFQSDVDDYIAGRISEDEFLRTTKYCSRWGFDYRLYAPIFRKRLRDAFEEHSGMTCDHFVEAQLVWDQGTWNSAQAFLIASNC